MGGVQRWCLIAWCLCLFVLQVHDLMAVYIYIYCIRIDEYTEKGYLIYNSLSPLGGNA
jgi:hypothetical protein